MALVLTLGIAVALVPAAAFVPARILPLPLLLLLSLLLAQPHAVGLAAAHVPASAHSFAHRVAPGSAHAPCVRDNR